MEGKKASERITVTLQEGQREALQDIADYNNAPLSYVVRFALRRFIEEHGGGQLRLEIPVR